MTKPGGTAIPACASSPNEPPLPPTAGRSLRVISANQLMLSDERMASPFSRLLSEPAFSCKHGMLFPYSVNSPRLPPYVIAGWSPHHGLHRRECAGRL